MKKPRLCIHCGHSETHHLWQMKDHCNPYETVEGYKAKLAECQGFALKEKTRHDFEKERADFEMACYERRAQGRVAWGRFACIMSQHALDKKLANVHDEKEREAILEQARRANHHLLIG